MITTGSIDKVRAITKGAKHKGKVVGFVPTMGALHEGHLSLVRAARKDCDFVVVSIFVNPTQFAPSEDFRQYPRNFEKDKRLLKKERADLIFCPSVKGIYSHNSSTYVEEASLSEVLCGSSRPGHFRGVCTVVAKLFNIVGPDIAYFGQKDYQQAQIIKRMTAGLNFPIKIKILPIIRERDGLAMSSRNNYLKGQDREKATSLFAALKVAKRIIAEGERNPQKVVNKMKEVVKSKKNTKIDYIKIVDANNLNDLERIKGKVLIALAVYVGGTRLIDNIVLNVKK